MSCTDSPITAFVCLMIALHHAAQLTPQLPFVVFVLVCFACCSNTPSPVFSE
jgi:hypothetical protein